MRQLRTIWAILVALSMIALSNISAAETVLFSAENDTTESTPNGGMSILSTSKNVNHWRLTYSHDVSCTGLQGYRIDSLYWYNGASNEPVIGFGAGVHGMRYRYTSGGSNYNKQICEMTEGSTSEGAGRSGDEATSYKVSASYYWQSGSNIIRMTEYFEIYDVNGVGNFIEFGIAFKKDAGSLDYAQTFWIINWDFTTKTSNNGYGWISDAWSQSTHESIYLTSDYSSVKYTGSSKKVINSGHGCPAGWASPTTTRWAVIQTWDDFFIFNNNDNGDDSSDADITGGWQVNKDSGTFTAGTYYGEYSQYVYGSV